MARLILGLMELFLSSMVHMLFGLYIFSTAVASDLSQVATHCLTPNIFNLTAREEEDKRGKVVVLDGSPELPPPIVLVHGIFGFGKGVRMSFHLMT